MQEIFMTMQIMTNVTVHKIVTGDATPIKKAPYRTPFALRQEMDRFRRC
jgi:hypothetical protein